MTPPPDDSSSSRRQSTPKDTLAKFASLLGTFRLKKAAENPESPLESVFVPNNNSLVRLFESESHDTRLGSFSSLSLATLVGEKHVVPGTEKELVEAHAVSNLSRALIVDTSADAQYRFTSGADSDESLEPFITDDLSNVPNLILDNVAASFACLVEARLRAYLTLLARHGVSISTSNDIPDDEKDEAIQAVEHKLACLLQIGTHISVDNLVTNFGAPGKLVFPSRKDGMETIATPIGMAAGLDVVIPRLEPSAGSERLAIAAKTGGFITGTFREGSTRLSSVEVELDTGRLLSVMMHEAARVISTALEHANEVSTLLRSIESTTDAKLAQVPTHAPLQKREVRMPDAVAELDGPEVPIVSPDLRALLESRREVASLPPLNLADRDDDDNAEVSSDLSPSSCANIVDFVMEEVGDNCFLTSRPRKKMRLDARPQVM